MEAHNYLSWHVIVFIYICVHQRTKRYLKNKHFILSTYLLLDVSNIILKSVQAKIKNFR